MSDHASEFRDLFLQLRINDQLTFYNERRAEYRAAHRQVVLVRNGLLFVAAVLGVVAAAVADARAALGLVAAVLAALATAVTAFETLMGFSHLDKLYGDAARNLAAAAVDWRHPTADVSLEKEVERVERIFTTERGQWGQLLVPSRTPEQPPPGG